jgi:hypothetical protein
MGAIGIIPFLIGIAFTIWRGLYRLRTANRDSLSLANATVAFLLVVIVLLALGLVFVQTAKSVNFSENSEWSPVFIFIVAFFTAASPGILLETLVATYRLVCRNRSRF